MATTPKATAKRSRTTKTDKALDKAVVKARKAGVKAYRKATEPAKNAKATADSIAKRYAIAREFAHSAQVRPPKAPTGKFLAGILTADKLPALPAEIQGRSAVDAGKRREWCQTHNAPKVTTADVVHKHRTKDKAKTKGITHDRPENTVLADLQAYCAVMGLAPDTYRAVRAKAYKAGEVPPVYIVRNR